MFASNYVRVNKASKAEPKDIILKYCLWILRGLIIFTLLSVFFPTFNPARISGNISYQISLFTSMLSYNDVTFKLLRAFDNGWIDESIFIYLSISCAIIVIGVILCLIGAIMSLGNTRMKKFGLRFPLAGAFTVYLGHIGIYICFKLLQKSKNLDIAKPVFPSNFYYFIVMASLILVFTVICLILLRNKPDELEMKIQEKFSLFLYFTPIIFLTFLFSYMPLWGWRYAFYEYQAGEPLTKFVGLKWFKFFVQNAAYSQQLLLVLRNTFIMSGLGIATSWLPIVFAIFLNEIKHIRFKKFVQTFTTIPNFISWVLVYAVAFAIFNTDGFLNDFLELFGVHKNVNYLDDPRGIWFKMLLWGIWKGLGWSAIIYIAGIASIDQQLYESAMIDGAGRFQRMWYITVPGLMPTYSVLLLLSIAGILSNGMEQYLVFSNNENMEKIQVLDLYVYNLVFGHSATYTNIPISTVVSMSKSLVSMVLLFSVNALSKVFRDGESII
ncbi:MAG TPA: ABC transporter permease subunit [Clostridia bacterium]